MHMAIHHPRHDELIRGIEHPHIAAACGDCRRWADSHNALVLDTDNAMAHDLTVDRIEYRAADNLQEAHRKLPQEFALPAGMMTWTLGSR
jgi:hypothetical protein